jgi:hypothetical protein
MRCPACDAFIPAKAKECPECGEKIKRKKKDGDDDEGGSGSGKIRKAIPTKNPLALIGYYIGVASLIPYLALLLGPIAILLGGFGIIYGLNNKKAKGTGHGIAAIVCAVIGLIGTIIFMVLISKGILDSPLDRFKKKKDPDAPKSRAAFAPGPFPLPARGQPSLPLQCIYAQLPPPSAGESRPETEPPTRT